MSEHRPLYCSFCGKEQYEVHKLIMGPAVYICNECIELCMDIIRDENGRVDGEAEYQSWLNTENAEYPYEHSRSDQPA